MEDSLLYLNSKLQAVLDSSKSVVTKLVQVESIQEQIKRNIEQLDVELEFAKTRLNSEEILRSAIAIASGLSQEILKRNMLEAISINQEFDFSPYRERFLSVAENPNIISIVQTGTEFFVDIRMDEVAGSIHQYAEAIKKVREILQSQKRVQVSAPEYLKSHFWREKFYGPAREGKKVKRRRFNKESKTYEEIDITDQQIEKYWNTINMRMQHFGSLAPFWEIIDKGTVVMKGAMGSSGGTPYPTNSSTNFVDKTINEITRDVREFEAEKYEQLEQNVRRIRAIISEHLDVLAEFRGIITALENIEAIEEFPPENENDYVLDTLERLEPKIKYANPEKVANLLNAIRDRDLSSLNITAEKRIELTAPGGPRVRLGITQLVREFGLGNIGEDF